MTRGGLFLFLITLVERSDRISTFILKNVVIAFFLSNVLLRKYIGPYFLILEADVKVGNVLLPVVENNYIDYMVK